MVSKEGYNLVTNVTKGITVDPRQSENTFSFVMNDLRCETQGSQCQAGLFDFPQCDNGKALKNVLC